MNTNLALQESASATAVGISDALNSAAGYALAEKSENTRRAYRHGYERFVVWCGIVGRQPLPASAETAAAYFAHCADSGLKVSTIQISAAAIAYADCGAKIVVLSN